MENEIVEAYKCNQCVKVFTSLESLKIHEISKSCNKSLVCIICDKIFPSIAKFQSHKRSVHSTDKSHECPLCQRMFTLKSNLRRHILRHGGEKSYVCKTCGKGFSTDSNLATHSRVHTIRKTFSCQLCNNTYVSKHGLRKHMMDHSGERPFPCGICEMTFKENYALKAHMKTHLKDPQANVEEIYYNCDFCGRRYKQKRSLKKHLLNYCKFYVKSEIENLCIDNSGSSDGISTNDNSNAFMEDKICINEENYSNTGSEYVYLTDKMEKDSVDVKVEVDTEMDDEIDIALLKPQMIFVEEPVEQGKQTRILNSFKEEIETDPLA